MHPPSKGCVISDLILSYLLFRRRGEALFPFLQFFLQSNKLDRTMPHTSCVMIRYSAK